MQARVKSDGINLRQERYTIEQHRVEFIRANDELFSLRNDEVNLYDDDELWRSCLVIANVQNTTKFIYTYIY